MLAEQGVLTAMTDTMMALRAHARGGPEQLVYEAAPVPVPGPGEALAAVHAAAITFAELSWDESWTTRDGRDRTPVIPSHEVSGTVAALGPGADGVTVGEEVYGLIDFDRDGAAAEYVTVPAAHLAARPRSVSDEEAATLPLAALTAWQALVDHAAVKPGERVLVQGGAGGAQAFNKDWYTTRSRFNLTEDTRTASEYGVVRTYANVQMDWTRGVSGIAGGAPVTDGGEAGACSARADAAKANTASVPSITRRA